jgi:hypothetical protein
MYEAVLTWAQSLERRIPYAVAGRRPLCIAADDRSWRNYRSRGCGLGLAAPPADRDERLLGRNARLDLPPAGQLAPRLPLQLGQTLAHDRHEDDPPLAAFRLRSQSGAFLPLVRGIGGRVSP